MSDKRGLNVKKYTGRVSEIRERLQPHGVTVLPVEKVGSFVLYGLKRFL
jgi:hypothetical protein